jgi:hypothetical protein
MMDSFRFAIILPELAAGTEITFYKPTYRYRSALGE